MKRLTILCGLLLFSIITGKERITILYTSNINGELENCLCEDHPYGALEKIKYQLDAIDNSLTETFVFDAGDFFTPFGDTRKNLLVARALKLIPYDALALGDQEFAAGTDFFKNIILPAKNGYVTINLKLDGKVLGQPKIITTKNGLPIHVIGLIGGKVFNYFEKEKIKGVEVLDPMPALRDYLSGLTDSGKLVIVLSHLGLDSDRELAEAFPQIDLIIGAHSQDALQKPEKIGKVYVTQAGADGYSLGVLNMSIDNQGHIKTLNGYLKQMSFDLPNSPDMVSLAKEDNWDRFRVFFRSQNITPRVANKYAILPADSCAGCHQAQYKNWQGSAHAKSFKTLKEKKRTKMLKCINCHVSGFARMDGFFNENLTGGLASVTCTECHLTLPAHLSSTKSEYVKAPDENLCRRCHDAENDPDFNMKSSVKKITH